MKIDRGHSSQLKTAKELIFECSDNNLAYQIIFNIPTSKPRKY